MKRVVWDKYEKVINNESGLICCYLGCENCLWVPHHNIKLMNMDDEQVREGGTNETNVTASDDECNHSSEGIVHRIITCSQFHIQERQNRKMHNQKTFWMNCARFKTCTMCQTHVNTCNGSQWQEHRMSCFRQDMSRVTPVISRTYEHVRIYGNYSDIEKYSKWYYMFMFSADNKKWTRNESSLNEHCYGRGTRRPCKCICPET